jgi:hypothetical protein
VDDAPNAGGRGGSSARLAGVERAGEPSLARRAAPDQGAGDRVRDGAPGRAAAAREARLERAGGASASVSGQLGGEPA